MLRVGGIILCGGQSKRMGRPKAWLPLGGEFLLPRVVRLLRPAVDPIVVVAAPEQEVPPLPDDIAIVRDGEKGRGPLQGLVAGLAALHDRVDAAYLSSCDVPFLQPAFVHRLVALLGSYAACVPHVGGYHHTLAAVYRLEVAAAAQQLLAGKRLRLALLLDIVPTRCVETEELADLDPTFQTLRNLNTPEEYAAAVRDAESAEKPL